MLAKRVLETALSFVWPKRVLPRILYYHSVDRDAPLSMHPRTFASHLTWLRNAGYESMTLKAAAALLARGDLQPKSVVITFDNGYEDNFTDALPLLLESEMRATFFVVSGTVGANANAGRRLYANRMMMNAHQLREMARAGMEVGSHSRSHVDVQRTLENSPAAAELELLGSREDLEAVLGEQVVSFAYPNGQRGVFSAATRALVERAGYSYAVTTMWGSPRASDDLLCLPRIEMRYGDDVNILAKKMSGRYDFMVPVCRLTDRSKRW